MAYNAPELQLVGAAQNLVLLDNSLAEVKQLQCRDDWPTDIDSVSPAQYNTVPTW